MSEIALAYWTLLSTTTVWQLLWHIKVGSCTPIYIAITIKTVSKLLLTLKIFSINLCSRWSGYYFIWQVRKLATGTLSFLIMKLLRTPVTSWTVRIGHTADLAPSTLTADLRCSRAETNECCKAIIPQLKSKINTL